MPKNSHAVVAATLPLTLAFAAVWFVGYWRQGNSGRAARRAIKKSKAAAKAKLKADQQAVEAAQKERNQKRKAEQQAAQEAQAAKEAKRVAEQRALQAEQEAVEREKAAIWDRHRPRLELWQSDKTVR